MGGKGSGRKRLSDREILEELLEQIISLKRDALTLHMKTDVLMQRITYFLKTRCGLVTKDGLFDFKRVDHDRSKR